MLALSTSSSSLAALLLLATSVASVEGSTFSLRGGPKFRHMRRAGAAIDGEILAGAPVSNITISTSNVVQCGQAVISWTGATNPSTLSVGTGGYYVGITNIETMPSLPGPSTEWTVSAQADTDLIFQITDANGVIAYAQNVRVQASDDDWCLDASATQTDDGSSAAVASATASAAASDDSDDNGYSGASSTTTDSMAAATASTSVGTTVNATSTKTKSSSKAASATGQAGYTGVGAVTATVNGTAAATTSSSGAAANSSVTQGTLAGANAGVTSGAWIQRSMSAPALGLVTLALMATSLML